VTTQELASLRSASHVAETLRQRYGSTRVKVVLNRLDRESMIAPGDVDRAAGGPVAHQIPSDYRAAVEALNAGRPLVLDPDSRVGASMSAVARELAGVAKERTKKQTGMLTRFVLRRA
jgi:pilus assembly protein CpaE